MIAIIALKAKVTIMGDFIPKAPIRRSMRDVGAFLVADDAVDTLVEYLEKLGGDISKKALEVAESDKRKKITSDDVYAALKGK